MLRFLRKKKQIFQDYGGGWARDRRTDHVCRVAGIRVSERCTSSRKCVQLVARLPPEDAGEERATKGAARGLPRKAVRERRTSGAGRK